MSATASGQRRLDGTEQGVNAEISNDNVQVAFPGSSYVSNMSTPETTFFVDDNIVPTKIENIPGIYTLFNLKGNFMALCKYVR